MFVLDWRLASKRPTHFIAETEWNFWMAEDVVKKLPENFQRFAFSARRDLSRVKDKLKTLKAGDGFSTRRDIPLPCKSRGRENWLIFAALMAK